MDEQEVRMKGTGLNQLRLEINDDRPKDQVDKGGLVDRF